MSVIQVGVIPITQSHPVIPLKNVQITGPKVKKVGNVWWVDEHTEMIITGQMDNVIHVPGGTDLVIPFPDTVMSCPIMKMLNGKPVDNPRTKVRIFNVPALTPQAPSLVMIEMKLKLPAGDYLLSPEYLNRSLEEIDEQFRLSFDPVSIDSQMVV
jgi:hypothetical protein